MTHVVVCTDSSAHAAPGPAVVVVPVTVVVDGAEHDDTTLDPDRFYELLDRGAAVSTAQPSPGRFAAAYAAAAADGATAVVSVHLDARASGTVGSAELGAREAPLPVTVVDAGTVGYGVGIAVAAAAAAAAAGAAAGEVAAAARAAAAGLRNAFVAGGTPGGRVPATDGLTLLASADGETAVLGRSAGPEDAVTALAKAILVDGPPAAAAVGHAHRATSAWADELAALLGQAGVEELDRYRVRPSVGAHTGPGCFGAFWRPAASEESSWPDRAS